MVFAFAAVSTVCSSLFAIATAQRAGSGRGPHQWAWTVSMVWFALASAALAVGVSTGWDGATYRVFYAGGAILSVPWLALGTVFLHLGGRVGRALRHGVLAFSGLAVGVMLVVPMEPVSGTSIPVGRDVFPAAAPRVLAALGSGIGALVVLTGALWSLARLVTGPAVLGRSHLAAANALVAAGTLVLSGGGLAQGIVGHDEAFALSLALGVAVIYAGFLVADRRPRRPPIAVGRSHAP